MTITVFDTRDPENRIARLPEHQKPTFASAAIKMGLLHVRILQLHSNLNLFDKALDDMQDCIMELEEIVNNE